MTRALILLALLATPAAAETRWSMTYDLTGAVTAAGPSATLDLSAAYRVGQHGHLFISAHTPLVKPKPYRIETHTTLTTETLAGPCRCVTVNNTFQTQINGYVGGDDAPSIRAGLAWDWGRNVSASVYIEGVRKGSPVVGVQVSVHGKVGE